MLYFTEDDVRRMLSMSECIRLMRETFKALRDGTAQSQPRRRMFMPEGSVLHAMAGSITMQSGGSYFGTKIYGTHVKHGAHFFFHLFDSNTAQPLALMEANWLGQIRTGAASGYATDILSKPGAATVGLIGSGFQARSQLEATLAVRPVKEVRVYSRSAEKRERFAAECSRAFSVNVRAVDSAESAVRGAEIVSTATWSKDPVLEAQWVEPDAHVNAMGSNNPDRRELPKSLLDRAALIAADSIEQARIESGDLILAWTPKDWKSPKLVNLQDVEGLRADGITIFKSNGLGVEDVAAAAFIYEQAILEPQAADRYRAKR
ncbi:MAG: ornithine cyclodeaminase family protein [Bryobacteraceae bacterium]